MVDVPPHPSSLYLPRDEYYDARLRQDRHLTSEFASLHNSIDQVKRELKEFKDDVKEFKDDVKEFKDDVKEFKDDVKEFKDDVKAQFQEVNSRFDRLEDDVREFKDDVKENFNRLEAESRRSYAYFRNRTLENPILPIQPIVVYRPGQGVLEPSPDYFPGHAKQFYALKVPKSTHHFDTLAYLAKFYDVHLPLPADSSDDESTDDEPTISRPDLLLEALEHILGLDEDRFKKFAERAQEQSTRSHHRPVKRSLLPVQDPDPGVQRRRLEIRAPHLDLPRQSPQTVSSDGLAAKVEWKARSTPSSQRPTVNGLRKIRKEFERAQQLETEPQRDEEPELSDSDGSTRAFTHPRAASP